MGKIRIRDLAEKMGVPEQDLVFKLKSIGVRVDEEDAQIDASVIQAILEGKRLPQPREVILRDEEAKASAPPPKARRRTPARRLPPNPLRPSRRRTIIQKVEPRIKTIPTSEPPRPAESPTTGAAAGTTATKKAPITRAAPPGVKKDAKRPSAPQAGDRPVSAKVSPADRSSAEVDKKEAPDRSRRSRRRAERRKQEAEEAGRVLNFKVDAPESPVTISEGMTVRDFADKLGVKAKDLIQILMQRGVMATINHVMEPELAQEIAGELGVDSMEVSFEEEVQLAQEVQLEGEEEEAQEPRAPVVTIMGHVDHGKTTLLDAIRSSRVTESEHGGITQHIGAYSVDVGERRIVFLDTPGHEAFTLMRARGAKATDIVVLVVAADDGVMPQTIEALDHARAADVPIVVAINKIDRADANPDRVKKELADHELTVEDWGGDTVAVPLSALKQDGISELLEMISLTADLLDLTANSDHHGQGVVLEARKDTGRGIVANVLLQDGSLGKGDVFVAGAAWGRVRAMTDDRGQRVEEVGPANPVEVTGFAEIPEAGDLFQVVDDEIKARSIAEFRQQKLRIKELAPSIGKASLEQLFERIQEGTIKELPIVLKGDVQGSVEVLRDTLQKLSTDAVKLQVIHAGVGAITTNDVILASASNAIIVGFNVRPERKATELAQKEEVEIRLHTVIYELSDEIRKAMTGLLEPVIEEVDTGRAEVREIFSVPKLGMVAGCHVTEGLIPRNASVRLLRDNVVVYEGKIASLRRFKDDVAEVRSGFDCGIRLDRYQDVKPGDTIEAFVEKEVAPKL